MIYYVITTFVATPTFENLHLPLNNVLLMCVPFYLLSYFVIKQSLLLLPPFSMRKFFWIYLFLLSDLTLWVGLNENSDVFHYDTFIQIFSYFLIYPFLFPFLKLFLLPLVLLNNCTP